MGDAPAVRDYLESQVRSVVEELVTPVLEQRPADAKRALFNRIALDLGLPTGRRNSDRVLDEISGKLGSVDKARRPSLDQRKRNSLNALQAQKVSIYKRESRLKSFFGDAGKRKGDTQDLLRLFEATKRITSEISPQATCQVIASEIFSCLQCAEVGLFVAHEQNRSFKLIRHDGEYKCDYSGWQRVPFGKGLLWRCYEQKQGFMGDDVITDVATCDYFDPNVDLCCRRETLVSSAKSFICHPVLDYDDEPLGIIQACATESFSEKARLMLHQLSQHCAIALRNALVYREAIVQHERAIGLLSIAKTLSLSLGAQSTISAVQSNASQLVQADRCTLFLVDHTRQELWSIATDSGKEIRIPLSAGLVGKCAASREVLNIPDAYELPQFNRAVDKATGYRTKSILCIPVVTGDRILAVIQLINKCEVDGTAGEFENEEVDVMLTFANYVASEFATSGFLSRYGQEKNKEFPGEDAQRSSKKAPRGSKGGALLNARRSEGDSPGLQSPMGPGENSLSPGSSNAANRKSVRAKDRASMAAPAQIKEGDE